MIDAPFRPYRPSNGTEGAMFEDAYCSRCKHDAEGRATGNGGCMILLRALCFDLSDAEYPTEWVFDTVAEEPRCLAFGPDDGSDGTVPYVSPDPGQGNLFVPIEEVPADVPERVSA